MSLKRGLVVATFMVAFTLLAASPAFAGKPSGGSGGGKGHGGSSSTATLLVSPNPVPAFSWFEVTGCGYVPGETVQLSLWTSSAITSRVSVASSTGCIALPWEANSAGSYTLKAATGARSRFVASISFEVY